LVYFFGLNSSKFKFLADLAGNLFAIADLIFADEARTFDRLSIICLKKIRLRHFVTFLNLLNLFRARKTFVNLKIHPYQIKTRISFTNQLFIQVFIVFLLLLSKRLEI